MNSRGDQRQAMADSLAARSRYRRGVPGWYVVRRDALTVAALGPFRRRASAEGRCGDWSRFTVVYVGDVPAAAGASPADVVRPVLGEQLSLFDREAPGHVDCD